MRDDADPLQLAMLPINPATAYLLPHKYAKLAAGRELAPLPPRGAVLTQVRNLLEFARQHGCERRRRGCEA